MSALLPGQGAAAGMTATVAETSVWRHLPWPIRACAFYGCLALLGVLLLGGCALSSVLSLVLPRRRRRSTGRALISGCFRLFLALSGSLGLMRLDLSALDTLNDEHGLIVAPNHPSMLDAALVASRVRCTGCIMKAELWDNPFLGAGARLADYVRNDSINSMIRQAAADLQGGGKLLMFPEGTRTTKLPVNPLKGGIALIAQRAGVAIQTVLIETNSPYLGKGWPLFRMPEFPLVYRATLGPRLMPGKSSAETLAAMQSFYSEALTDTTWLLNESFSAQAQRGFGPL